MAADQHGNVGLEDVAQSIDKSYGQIYASLLEHLATLAHDHATELDEAQVNQLASLPEASDIWNLFVEFEAA